MRSARDVARRALRRIERDGLFASVVLADELAASSLSRPDRGLATEITYGVLRHRSRLDVTLAGQLAVDGNRKRPSAKLWNVLRVGAYQLLYLDRVPDHAAVNDAVNAARRVGGQRVGGFVNAILRGIAVHGVYGRPDDTDMLERIAFDHSTPGWIVDHMRDALGEDDLDANVAAMNASAPMTLRTNTLRTTRDVLLERLTRDHPDAVFEAGPGEAIFAKRLGDPTQAPSFADGLWIVQDVGAQRVGELVGAAQGQSILDACSGHGGKATHLAQLTGDRADIDAVDLSEGKLERAAQTAARLGLTSIRRRVVDLIAEPLTRRYSAVLLDAPCSGLGVLRRHPEAKWRVTPQKVAELAELQRGLLDAVAPAVEPGGVLVYAVCTFTTVEGADQVAAFLEGHPEFRQDGEPLRTWPHLDRADAFYAARLVRDGASD